MGHYLAHPPKKTRYADVGINIDRIYPYYPGTVPEDEKRTRRTHGDISNSTSLPAAAAAAACTPTTTPTCVSGGGAAVSDSYVQTGVVDDRAAWQTQKQRR